jgi:hypothetical protein
MTNTGHDIKINNIQRPDNTTGYMEHLVKDTTDMIESHQLQQGGAILVQSNWAAHRNRPETHPMGSKTKHKNLQIPPTNPTGLHPTSYVILADWV